MMLLSESSKWRVPVSFYWKTAYARRNSICVSLISSLILVVLYRLSVMKHWQGSFRVCQNHKDDDVRSSS